MTDVKEMSENPDKATEFIKDCFPVTLDEQFFIDPASCRFHGNWRGGLVQHSLRVLYHCHRLQPVMAPDTNITQMEYAAVLHDLCKVGSYEITTRNVKKNGTWTQEPFYMNKKGLITVGHGAESCRRIEKLGLTLDEPWYQAVRWHMGMYDATDTDRYAMTAATAKYPEVLLLQTADIIAGIVEEI